MNGLFASNSSNIGARASDVVRMAKSCHGPDDRTIRMRSFRRVCRGDRGDYIKLTNTDGGNGQSKLIPWDWVELVDSCVYLNRDYEEVTGNI